MITPWHFLAVGAVLFGLGLVGFLTRRNLITAFLCAELMLQGVVLNLLAFGKMHGHLGGQVFALFILTVAACEAGLALALFLTLYRKHKTLDATEWQQAREGGLPETRDVDPLPAVAAADYPTLHPAGVRPAEEPLRV